MLIDKERLDALYSGDDEEDEKWFREMIDTLLENMETRLTNIQQNIEENNNPQLQKELHQVKGMSLNFGLSLLSEKAKEAEAFVKEGKVDSAIPVATGLRELWEKTKKELMEYVNPK